MKHRITFIFALLTSSMGLAAQIPSAPIPAQIAGAKSVFLANAGSTPANNQFAIIAYNTVYQELAAGNRYHLTSTPADADLTFEISVISVFEGNINWAQYVQVVIRDPKSQSLLWSTAEGIGVAAREKTLEKNIGDSAAKLATDLANLSSAAAATPTHTPAPTKTRLSDEPKK